MVVTKPVLEILAHIKICFIFASNFKKLGGSATSASILPKVAGNMVWYGLAGMIWYGRVEYGRVWWIYGRLINQEEGQHLCLVHLGEYPLDIIQHYNHHHFSAPAQALH